MRNRFFALSFAFFLNWLTSQGELCAQYPNYAPGSDSPQYYPTSPSTPPRPDPGVQILDIIVDGLIELNKPQPPRPQPPRPQIIYNYPAPQKIVAPPPPAAVEPLKNEVVLQPTKPPSNSSPFSLTKKVSSKLIKDMQKQVDSTVDVADEEIQIVINSRFPPLEDLVSSVMTTSTLQDQQLVLEKAKAGDSAFVSLATAGNLSAEAQLLREYAAAVSALNEVSKASKQGTLDDGLRQKLMTALEKGGFIGQPEQIMPSLKLLDTANSVASVLQNAQPNASVGPLTTILYVGNMPINEVLWLGGGAALVGTGGETEGTVVTSGNLGQAVGMNLEAGSPVPDDSGDEVPTGAVITNAGQSEVNFVVSNARNKLEPGGSKSFPVTTSSKVEYFRSGSADKKSFRLEKAGYEFRLTENNWDLFKVKYKVTIDNSGNSMDFRFVSQNEQKVVGAGQTVSITSAYPVILRFDNGNNSVKQKRLQSGSFKVAVNSQGHLDLYVAGNVTTPAPVAEVIENSSIDLFGDWSESVSPGAQAKESREKAEADSSSPKLFN